MAGQLIARIEPQLPVQAMKTYQILAPKQSHFRPATCAEVDCEHHLAGWRSAIDESTDLGKRQAWYIRNEAGRRFTEDRNIRPGLTVFEFEPGQTCFGEHHARLDRPALYVVRGGDFRGNPTGQRRAHANAGDWVDDFATHQDQLQHEIEKG